MSASRDLDPVIRAWLDEGPATFADAALASVLAEVHATRQRRRAGWFRSLRSLGPADAGGARYAGLAISAVAVVVVIAAGIGVLGGLPDSGGPGPLPSPTATPPASASPSPARTPVTEWPMDSALYGYGMSFPAEDVTIQPTLATVAWDGETECLAQDACTDWVNLTGAPGVDDRTVWVFGTPTDLSLDAFAEDMQGRFAAWMGCPAVAPTVLSTSISDESTPARVHLFECPYESPTGPVATGMVRVFAVRDGFGIVIGLAKLASDEPVDTADELARLEGYLASFRWTD
jgi:hypothetical protein